MLQRAGIEVARADDLAQGDGGLPPTEGLRYHLAEGARVIVRPSGTEPKIKCYLEVVVPVDGTGPEAVGVARAVARERLDRIRTDVAAAAGL